MNEATAIFVANRGYALASSRTFLIRCFLDKGWKVILATSDDPESRELCRFGAHLEPVNFERGGLSPLADIRSYRRLSEIYRRWSPQMIHHFHAKPVIIGSVTARKDFKGSIRVVNTITGLGHAFVAGGNIAKLSGLGYHFSLRSSDMTIFQNRDDRKLFLKKGWAKESKVRLIASSGVDSKRFAFVDRGKKDGVFHVAMLGRLLRQKGIQEFIQVARCIKATWPQARFLWAGEEESVHPDAVSADWLQNQEEIEYLGRLADVRPLLHKADLLLFPSYYREGAPRAVLEAAATGLPTVGFDVPGVREVVRDKETGYLVPDRDVQAMSKRVHELLANDQLRLHMGRKARAFVESSFDLSSIMNQYLQVYRDLGLEV